MLYLTSLGLFQLGRSSCSKETVIPENDTWGKFLELLLEPILAKKDLNYKCQTKRQHELQ